jgi:hypothetical protein
LKKMMSTPRRLARKYVRDSYRAMKSVGDRYSKLRTFSNATASPARVARGSTATAGSQSRSWRGRCPNHHSKNRVKTPSRAANGCQSGYQRANAAVTVSTHPVATARPQRAPPQAS